jgi:hypothetical protein
VKLTVIISEAGAACNVGGPVTYRRITLDLTPEQTAALTLHDKWESHGTAFIEFDPNDKACSCQGRRDADAANVIAFDLEGRCYACGKTRPEPPAPARAETEP